MEPSRSATIRTISPSPFLEVLTAALEERFLMGVGSPGHRIVVNYSIVRLPDDVHLKIMLERGDELIADFTESSAVIYDQTWYKQILLIIEEILNSKSHKDHQFVVYTVNTRP